MISNQKKKPLGKTLFGAERPKNQRTRVVQDINGNDQDVMAWKERELQVTFERKLKVLPPLGRLCRIHWSCQ